MYKHLLSKSKSPAPIGLMYFPSQRRRASRILLTVPPLVYKDGYKNPKPYPYLSNTPPPGPGSRSWSSRPPGRFRRTHPSDEEPIPGFSPGLFSRNYIVKPVRKNPSFISTFQITLIQAEVTLPDRGNNIPAQKRKT